MSDSPRFTLNRTVLLLIPKEPFLDWLNDVDPADEPLTLEYVCDDCNVFLIPQFNDEADSYKWIEKHWSVLFEHMLLEWMIDEATWPENRTLAMFRSWFDIEMHTMAWDLAKEPLLVEDWHDEDEDEGADFRESEKIILH